MANDNSIIGKTIDGYQVQGMLGQGGMAAVYEATDLKLDRRVAMKVMHAHLSSQRSFRDLFVREAQNAARLDHPNIVNVYGFNVTGEYLYIVMELITGGNLRKYVKQLAAEGRFIDYPEAAEIVRQVAAAIDYAHERGMVHRDLKPDNIILKPLAPQPDAMNYQPIITDFGLAQLTTAGEETATATQPIGTYPYMSPEQVNAQPVDRRTDIYALGVILYELSLGRLPFHPKTIAEAARMHGREPVPLPSDFQRDFPEPLENIIMKALEKRQEDRYDSGGALATDLAKFIRMGEKPRSSLRLFPASSASQTDAGSPGDTPMLEDMDFDTALQTAPMTEPLPPYLSSAIEPLTRTPEELRSDYLAVYSLDRSFLYELVDIKSRFEIGREGGDDILLDGDLVSRNQGQIERKPNGKYYYIDNRSTNGTWYADARLDPGVPIILRNEDILRMGNWWVVFLEADPAAADAAAVPDPDDEKYTTDHAEQTTVADTGGASSEIETQEAGPAYQPAAEDVLPLEDAPARTSDMGIPTDMMGIAPPEAAPAMQPPSLTSAQVLQDRIVIYERGVPPRLVVLEKDTYTVGRSPDSDIVLPGRFVSWRHAVLERDVDRRIYVRPEETRNGTWFDQQSLAANTPHRLSARRTLRIGNYWIAFEAGRNVAIESLSSSASGLISRQERGDDDNIDTVAMVRPLDEEMPTFQMPPMNMELRAKDRLTFYSEDQPIQVEPLDKEVITIGRGTNQDIRLRGKRVSREHAVLELRPDGNIYLTDLESRNGVWVGDTLLVPQTQVLWAKHESLRIGNYWVKFQRGSGEMRGIGSQQDRRGLVGRSLGNYRIESYIGESAIAGTYRARDLQLEREVALKIMHPQLASQAALKQRFLDEARLVSRLDHPNVVQVMSYREVRGELFMVMELITGGNLRRLLVNASDQGKLLDLQTASEMVIQLANGLHYAHQQGLIHRDINPDNIILKAQDVVGPIKTYTPILTDFAVMRVASADAIYDRDVEDTSVLPYMSPEQCRGERNDARSDIYELGITFYELLIGRPPFLPKSLAEAVRMHTREEISAPSVYRPEIAGEVDAVILRAVEKDPNNRYQSAIDFSRALQRALALSGTELTGFSGDSFLSSIIDEFATQTMDGVLPQEMPLLTQPPIPDEDIRYDRLVFYSETHPTTVFDMSKPVVTIGRGDDQDVRLGANTISRRHLRVERSTDGTLRVRDEGATNGTLVGGYELIEGVAEVWDPVRTVRLGDYWLRVETKSQLENARKTVSLVGATPAPDDEDFETDAGWSPPPDAPAPDHDKIGVEVTQRQVVVQPGGSAVQSLEIVNQNDFVDHFEVEVVGLPAAWYTITSNEIDLMPYNRETMSITFHPPLNSKSSAGSHAYELRVKSQAKRISAVRTQCSLEVQPFYGFRTEVYPERVRNKGNVELTIRNTGNTYTTFNIAARDREQAVRFNIEGGVQYALAPGAVEDIGVRVEPKRRPMFGAAQFHQLEFIVTPTEEVAGGPQTTPGELAVTARLRVWMVILPLILLLLCAGLAGAALFLNRRQVNIEATQVAMNMATEVSATATAALEADDDGDGLSNRLEAELGTFPNLRDSDEDGLDDGVEYRVWGTDPLNRDTDGDNLSDGEEVLELGTNPLNPDTDGDGLRDDVDPFPLIPSTPMPTPFTITAEGCPASLPPRLVIGEVAFVETGGVANRLRAGPSLDETIIAFMQPDEDFVVLDGPTCGESDFLAWWQVDYGGVEGWTAESENDEYYLRPADVEPGSGGGDTGNEANLNSGAVVASLPEDGEVSINGDALGVQLYTNITPDQWNTVLASTGPLNVGWVKVQANWRYLQPDAPGQVPNQLNEFYSHLEASKAAGYNVMVSVAKAPDWARSTQGEAGPPDDPAALAAFVGQMLAASGDNIDAIEVWNEPNLSREWTGTLAFNGDGYMELFKPTYETIRAFSPDITIVTAGLAPAPTTETSVDDREFLRQMYGAGLGEYENIALGVHPYGWANAPDVLCCADEAAARGWDDDPKFFFIETVLAHRNIQLRFSDDDTPIWITEFGYTTWQDLGRTPPEAWMNFLTEDEKASYIYRAFEVGQSLDFVGPMFLWNLNFANSSTVDDANEVAGYSLTFQDGNGALSPRSAYQSLVNRLP